MAGKTAPLTVASSWQETLNNVSVSIQNVERISPQSILFQILTTPLLLATNLHWTRSHPVHWPLFRKSTSIASA